MANSLNIYYQNTQGLRTKTSTFKRNLTLNQFDIISLTETWLLDGVFDQELFDDRYLVWRRDRNYLNTHQKYGGGVLLAVRRDIPAIEQLDWQSSAEDLWVSLTIKKSKSSSNCLKIHICTLYLTNENGGNSFKVQLENFSRKLSDIVLSHPDDKFIIMGDFNLSNLVWHRECDHFLPSNISGAAQCNFFDIITMCNLHQYNNCHNISSNRLLDLVFANELLNIRWCSDPLVPENVHHKSLIITINNTKVKPLDVNSRIKYFYGSGDYKSFSSALDSVDWNKVLNTGTLEDALKLLHKNIYGLRDKFIPHKLITGNHYPPWYSSALKKVLKEKFSYWKKYKIYCNLYDYNTFSLLRDRAKELEVTCYELYLKTVQESVTKNPKALFSYVKSSSKSSSSFPSTMIYNDKTADNGRDVCELFNQYFKSTFLQSSQTYPGQFDSSYDDDDNSNTLNVISNIEVLPDQVHNLLQSVNCNNGSGPDSISPIIISKCAKSLTIPLSILFRRSIDEGTVPVIWKSAFITPIHKAGKEKIEKMEQKSRCAGIEIRNIPKTNKETKSNLCSIIKNVGKVLNVDLTDSDIKDIYRISSKDLTNPIVVEFSTVIMKEKMIKGVKLFNKSKMKGDKLNTTHLNYATATKPVYISETLTQKTQKLFYLARNFAKNSNYNFCWMSRGALHSCTEIYSQKK
ncbi:unnamed protein product [Euphydryas editha]|uniref:Endonuclease/exonuclease/phosphatase domain-containing protein n=1 Tax=Euphydryas editha TaxID=104508 RepID=A0AAU9UCM1_EUPED|nr:unnamed protein product [Euphydryas editha]